MTEQVPHGSVHPNIARLAAAYDRVIEEMGRGQLTGTQARAKIEQLEARDDQGVRWSIDPDTGQYVRKTLLGETQFDTPPVTGYQTPDAFSYSATAGSGIDPNLRVELYAETTTPPTQLAGATRNGPGTRPGAAGPGTGWWQQLPGSWRAAAALLAAVLLAALILL